MLCYAHIRERLTLNLFWFLTRKSRLFRVSQKTHSLFKSITQQMVVFEDRAISKCMCLQKLALQNYIMLLYTHILMLFPYNNNYLVPIAFQCLPDLHWFPVKLYGWSQIRDLFFRDEIMHLGNLLEIKILHRKMTKKWFIIGWNKIVILLRPHFEIKEKYLQITMNSSPWFWKFREFFFFISKFWHP